MQSATERVTRWSVWPTKDKDKDKVNGIGKNQMVSLCSVFTRVWRCRKITVNQGRSEHVPIMTYFKAFVPMKYEVHVHFVWPGTGITRIRQMRNEHETHQQISVAF